MYATYVTYATYVMINYMIGRGTSVCIIIFYTRPITVFVI